MRDKRLECVVRVAQFQGYILLPRMITKGFGSSRGGVALPVSLNVLDAIMVREERRPSKPVESGVV
jgi:hypothetical protein